MTNLMEFIRESGSLAVNECKEQNIVSKFTCDHAMPCIQKITNIKPLKLKDGTVIEFNITIIYDGIYNANIIWSYADIIVTREHIRIIGELDFVEDTERIYNQIAYSDSEYDDDYISVAIYAFEENNIKWYGDEDYAEEYKKNNSKRGN